MGKIDKSVPSRISTRDIIGAKQKFVLEQFKKDKYLKEKFYFTGGTALSLYYLQHRLSVDLDFFSEDKFDINEVITRLNNWKKLSEFSFTQTNIENTHIFLLEFPKNQTVKIDINFYPYKPLKKHRWIDGIKVNSQLDIAVNKMIAISQRTEVKDFVDLYFLLKEFTLWDLMDGVKVKFGFKTDPVFVASDFSKVDSFENMPKMIKPLTLKELKDFFKEKAKQVSKQSVI